VEWCNCELEIEFEWKCVQGWFDEWVEVVVGLLNQSFKGLT